LIYSSRAKYGIPSDQLLWDIFRKPKDKERKQATAFDRIENERMYWEEEQLNPLWCLDERIQNSK
jgi:hypothetical protein